MPKVMARVMGMDRAMSKAERHSQKPMKDTRTTSHTASPRASMNSSTFSSTCLGWSEVRAMIRSSGSLAATSARASSTCSENSSILCPWRMFTARVMPQARRQDPSLSLYMK